MSTPHDVDGGCTAVDPDRIVGSLHVEFDDHPSYPLAVHAVPPRVVVVVRYSIVPSREFRQKLRPQ